MSYTYTITHDPRGYTITNGENTFSWTAEAPHVIQPTPDDGTDAWLERAAQAAVEMFNHIEEQIPQEEAVAILQTALLRSVAQTAELTDAELDTVGKAGFFDEWAAGMSYTKDKRLVYEQVTYSVMQDIAVSLEHQPPGSPGTLALYRPIDPAKGTEDDPKKLIMGMDAIAGLYYRYNDQTWKCLRDLIPTFEGRMPGDPGMETYWEAVA